MCADMPCLVDRDPMRKKLAGFELILLDNRPTTQAEISCKIYEISDLRIDERKAPLLVFAGCCM